MVSVQQWHALDIDKALTELDAQAEGLSAAEAERRLAEYGPNELRETGGRSRWQILLDQ